MASLASFSPHLIRHRFILLRRPTPPLAKQSLPPLTSSAFYTRFLFSSPVSSRSVTQQLPSDVALLDNVQIEPEGETNTIAAAAAAASEGLRNSNFGAVKTPPPSLSVKEKKELASYAHSLGKKLKSQQVGKSGVTDTVVTALIETLEANELLKLKIHGTCPGEIEDVVKELEETTGSVVVGQIGRTVILYRPSLTKLKAEEKRKQAQRVYLKTQPVPKQSPQSRRPAPVPGQEPRQYGRGRRGSSRY